MNLVALPDFLPFELRGGLEGGVRHVTHWQGANTVWHAWGKAEHGTAVLLHGGSGSWTHWVRNIGPLCAAGWRVLVPDLPGFGDSDLPADCTDANDLPAHLHHGLQQLKPTGPVHVVGFSFGGMAAALWLTARPEDAQALVLVGAPGLGLSQPQRVALKGWRHLATSEAQAHVHRHNLLALMLQHEASLDPLALALHTANVQRDRMPRRRLSSSDILARSLPALPLKLSAIYGEHDALYGPRLPQVHACLAQGARCWGQWHCLPGAGHWVPYEAPEAFHAALIQILQS